ncbi:methyl-accepting chemotaxis protein, partial [Myxococcus xanthus]|nr:methyl-accepting chemotaxis protein [Myxococcus xanthus]
MSLPQQSFASQLSQQFRQSLGLAPKFVLVTALISATAATLLTGVATRRLESDLADSYLSAGRHVARGLAVAAEQGV